jgi:AcrR family transcriptional regulator
MYPKVWKSRGMSRAPKKSGVQTRGRPRSFDSERALEQALRVFWQRGYAGTSLSDLTKAMRINRPSLYAAYGDKQTLFRKVLDRYAAERESYVQDALDQPTAREVARALLTGAAESMCGDSQHPAGCLLVQGGLATGTENEAIRQELVSRRRANEALICQRMERAKEEGDLAKNAKPAVLARYLAAVTQGMAVQAAGGASRAQLLEVATTALKAWPEP